MVAAVAVSAAILTPVAMATAAPSTTAVTTAASTSAAAPYCGIRWGSVAKSTAGYPSGQLTNIRAGRHACYDRLVFDVRGNHVAYTVKYVSTMRADASNRVVPLRGGAKLSIVLQTPAYDLAGRPTYHFANKSELVNVRGYGTFRQVAFAGSFEAVTSVGLGVRARLPFRVFTLPGRVVVDVAHRW
jgi:hypothetical protein